MIMLFISCLNIDNILIAQTENYYSAEDIKELFEREYRAYIEAKRFDDKEFPVRSTSYGPRSYQHLHKIAKLGTRVLPYLVEKANETGDMSLGLPVYIITRKTFERSEWPEGKLGDSRTKVRLYIAWWEKGRKLTPQQFVKRHLEWKNQKNQGNDNEAKRKLENIRALGIAALPMIIDKVSLGQIELVPLLSALTSGKIDPNASIQQCLSWWEQNKKDWLIPFPNNQPQANAGRDVSVMAGDIVRLDGSASSDEDKDTLLYNWRQTAGPAVNLVDPNSANPSFQTPQVDTEPVLTFELVVDDSKNACPTPNSRSKPAIVNVTIQPGN